MSRVVWLLKKLQALKMAEETMAEEMVEETKLETHTRVQSAYIKIWCFVWYFCVTSIFTELNSHEQLSLFIFENYALSATPNVVCNFLSMNDISGESL